jgi:hypothetical protein
VTVKLSFVVSLSLCLNLNMEDNRLIFIWHLSLDLCGISGPTRSLRSRQHSLSCHWGVKTYLTTTKRYYSRINNYGHFGGKCYLHIRDRRLSVPNSSHNKQRLFPHTALTGWPLQRRPDVFPVRWKTKSKGLLQDTSTNSQLITVTKSGN